MGGLCRGPPGHPWVPSVGFGEQPQSPAQGDRTKGGWGVAPLLSAAKPQPGGARWGALLIAALEIVLNYDKRHPLCGLLTLRFNAPVADLRAPAPCSPGSPAPAPRGATRDGSSGRGDTTNTAASPSFHSIQRNVPPPGRSPPGAAPWWHQVLLLLPHLAKPRLRTCPAHGLAQASPCRARPELVDKACTASSSA